MRAAYILLPWLIICALLTTVDGQPKKRHPPNIVFFLVDDLGWRDTGPYGSTFYETPNIDQLATESMKFTNAYAASPVCSPTRASIMTGKYPARLHATDWFGAEQPEQLLQKPRFGVHQKLLPAHYVENLPLTEITLAEALAAGGYKTFYAGKWHLGKTPAYWPEKQGFDINKGGNDWGGPVSYFSPYHNPRLSDGPKGEYLPDRLADETSAFIQQNKNRPFFAYLAFYSVHEPLQAPVDVVKKYEVKKRRLKLTDDFGREGVSKVRNNQAHPLNAAVIESMDRAVGKVIGELKAYGLYENTAIVFFSDNGGVSIGQDLPTANYPLRGGKGWLYEGGIREPLLVRWPGVTKAGSLCNGLVSSTDFYPTLLEIAGLPLRTAQHLDGKSFRPLLSGKQRARAPLFWHYPHYSYQESAPASAVRDGPYKLIRWYEDGREELYNIDADQQESRNIVGEQPAIAARLGRELDDWLIKQGAWLPTANPSYDSSAWKFVDMGRLKKTGQ